MKGRKGGGHHHHHHHQTAIVIVIVTVNWTLYGTASDKLLIRK